MPGNKHDGSDFRDYLLGELGRDNRLAALHVAHALTSIRLNKFIDYIYLARAVSDVVVAKVKKLVSHRVG